MSNVEQIYDKLMAMKLSALLQTASIAMQSNLDEDRLRIVLLTLQERLMKRAMLVNMKMKLDVQDTK